MEGFGYIYGMINRSKSNDAYRKSMRNKRIKKKENLINSNKIDRKRNSSDPNLSITELEGIKKEIRRKIKAERKRDNILFITVAILVFTLIYLILYM